MRSAFARLGIDPWGEAARLAAMTPEKATLVLAGILARLPRTEVETPKGRGTVANAFGSRVVVEIDGRRDNYAVSEVRRPGASQA